MCIKLDCRYSWGSSSECKPCMTNRAGSLNWDASDWLAARSVAGSISSRVWIVAHGRGAALSVWLQHESAGLLCRSRRAAPPLGGSPYWAERPQDVAVAGTEQINKDHLFCHTHVDRRAAVSGLTAETCCCVANYCSTSTSLQQENPQDDRETDPHAWITHFYS